MFISRILHISRGYRRVKALFTLRLQSSPQTPQLIARLIMAGGTLAANAERRSKAPLEGGLREWPDARFAVIVNLAIRPTLNGAVCRLMGTHHYI